MGVEFCEIEYSGKKISCFRDSTNLFLNGKELFSIVGYDRTTFGKCWKKNKVVESKKLYRIVDNKIFISKKCLSMILQESKKTAKGISLKSIYEDVFDKAAKHVIENVNYDLELKNKEFKKATKQDLKLLTNALFELLEPIQKITDTINKVNESLKDS